MLIDKSDSNIAPEFISQKTNNHPLVTSLITRIDSLENKLEEEKTIRQQQEIRLTEIEQQLIASQFKSHLSQTNDAPVKPVKITVKPPTLHDKLIKSNIPLDIIQQIQSRVGEKRLARLQLRNQAIREDWIDTPKYIEQVQQLPRSTDGLREEFGDHTYDQYLYASGRPNRVIVREVFNGSTAQDAGLTEGDIILSYALNPIYSMSELQQATTEGNSGETVLIEVLRDELPVSTSVTRGPLGISMTIIRKAP